jgi:[ribosomal protein S5]-alanine N-acetyltransferase
MDPPTSLIEITRGVGLRAWLLEDSAALAAMYAAGREEIVLEEPWRGEAYFTPEGQRQRIAACLASHDVEGYVITEGGEIVGSMALDEIRRDVLQSAALGYWVDPRRRRRGVVTAAIAQVVVHAFSELGLHRLHATVDIDNVASWRALERNSFQQVGVISDFAFIQGTWRDHFLYQRTAESARC